MQAMNWHTPVGDQIRERSSTLVNQRIDRATYAKIAEVQSSPDRIRRRLHELDREWTVDRVLMLNFAIAGGMTATLALRAALRTGKLGGWSLLLGTQLGFLAHHAIRRWCPPMSVFRRLGIRSDREIASERAALEHLLRDREQPISSGPTEYVTPHR